MLRTKMYFSYVLTADVLNYRDTIIISIIVYSEIFAGDVYFTVGLYKTE